MTNQVIPAEAVEAAAIVHCNRGDSDWRDWTEDAKAEARQDMRASLEAAAPYILAVAWEEGVEALAEHPNPTNPYRPTR